MDLFLYIGMEQIPFKLVEASPNKITEKSKKNSIVTLIITYKSLSVTVSLSLYGIHMQQWKTPMHPKESHLQVSLYVSLVKIRS